MYKFPFKPKSINPPQINYITIISPLPRFVNRILLFAFSIFLGVAIPPPYAYNVVVAIKERRIFMEYIPINEAKLKVILESADLVRWDIRAEDLDYSNPEAKFVFEDILQHAKDAFGFDTSGYKILLQLFPSKDGSCELFITRLSARSSGISSEALLRPSESAAYSFERLSHLISVCKRLIDAGFCGESSAWTDELGKWYLLLSESKVK